MNIYQRSALISKCHNDCTEILIQLMKSHGIRSKGTTESGGHADPQVQSIFMGKDDDAELGVIISLKLGRNSWSAKIKGFSTSKDWGSQTFNEPLTFRGYASDGLPASAQKHIQRCMLWAIEQ